MLFDISKQNVRILPKSVIKFLVFTSVIKRREFSLPRRYQLKSMEVKGTRIRNQKAGMINST